EPGMTEIIPLAYAKASGKPAINFENAVDRFARDMNVKRLRLRHLGNADDAPVRRNEDHVERQKRILHPERSRHADAMEKEHPRILRQFGAEHQSLLLLFRCQCQFKLERMNGTAFRLDNRAAYFLP